MSEDECREHDITFAAPLKVRMRLKIKSGENAGEIKEQDIFMGDFPLMTDNGTFIINGAERVVVSQLVRSPGVYFTVEEDPTSGRDLCMGKLIPSRGAWLEFETSSRDVMSVKVDRKRKIPVTTLLRALPRVVPEFTAVAKGTDEEILALFEGVDEGSDHRFVQSTLDKDPAVERRGGAARVLPSPAPRRSAQRRQRALAAELAVLQLPPLRPGQGRPLQGQQAPRPADGHHRAHPDAGRPGRDRARDGAHQPRQGHAPTTSTTSATAACARSAS